MGPSARLWSNISCWSAEKRMPEQRACNALKQAALSYTGSVLLASWKGRSEASLEQQQHTQKIFSGPCTQSSNYYGWLIHGVAGK